MFTVSAKLQAQINLMIEADHDYIPNPDGLGEDYSVYNFFDEGAFIVNTNGECDMNKATKLMQVFYKGEEPAAKTAKENKPYKQGKLKAVVFFEYRNHVGLFVAYDKKTNEEILDDTDFDRLCNMLSDCGYDDVEYISLKPTLVAKL